MGKGSKYLDAEAEKALAEIIDLCQRKTGITITYSQAVMFLYHSWKGTGVGWKAKEIDQNGSILNETVLTNGDGRIDA